ncbi:hypothetical protein ACFFRR_006081 [Megaselia abdita]
MNKVILCVVVLTALCQTALSACICSDSSQLCGSKTDLSTFYTCNGKDTVTLSCPDGSGFLFDSQTTGCVDYSDARWSCLNPLKTLSVTKPKTCTSTYPIAAGANNFWVCVDNVATLTPCVAATPLFYSDGNQLGCYNFADWVNASGCGINTAYYF